jgi:phosphatidate cytidylyltransferase
MSLLCYYEFSGLVTSHGLPTPGSVGVLSGLFVLLWPEVSGVYGATLLGISLLTMLAFVVALRRADLESILPYVSCVVLSALYTFAPWRFSIDLRKQSVHLLFFALALNWIGDSAAFYAGRAFGKHRLAPIVSPNKSWEGAAASVATSVIFGILYLGHFLPQLGWWQIVIMAAAGNVAGQLGDLAESAMKRGAGAKDSGTLLPGHGGMLDRVDSSLFALPTVLAIYSLILGFRS